MEHQQIHFKVVTCLEQEKSTKKVKCINEFEKSNSPHSRNS